MFEEIDPALMDALSYCLIWIHECTSNAHFILVSVAIFPV